MNRLALCARCPQENVVSEAMDLRHSLRDSMDHVTDVLFRPKSKPVWSWWYSPREFDPKEAPQAPKSTISELLDPKLPRKAGSTSSPGAPMHGHAPLKVQPLRAPFLSAGGLVKKLERMVKGENEPIDELKGR